MSAEPIRVLFLVSSLCIGGAEKHTVALLNRLDSSKFASSLIYLKPVEALLPQISAARRHAVSCLGVRHRLDWAAIGRLAEFIAANQIDIIVCTNEYPALYAWLAVRRAKAAAKLVEIFHTTTFGRIKDQLKMLLYRSVFKRMDLLIYVSDKQRQYWRQNGLTAKRDIVIHNGIDLTHFSKQFSAAAICATRASHGFPAQAFLIGICAALRAEKAHVDLLQALALLHSRGTEAKLMIIGDGPERPAIERCVRKLGLDSAVAITGFSSDVRPLLASCDVLVLASHAETFSIAALEAMAMEKPIVLTRIGGAEEQVSDGVNGFLYEPGDIDALAGHLQRLQTPQARAPVGIRGRTMVQDRFSESTMLDKFAAQFAALAQRPKIEDPA